MELRDTPMIEDGDIFMTSKEAAAFLKYSPWTLAQWRSEKINIPYIKGRNGKILYRKSDLIQFLSTWYRENHCVIVE